MAPLSLSRQWHGNIEGTAQIIAAAADRGSRLRAHVQTLETPSAELDRGIEVHAQIHLLTLALPRRTHSSGVILRFVCWCHRLRKYFHRR